MHHSLEGTRVVAIEQAVAAPLCSRHLADLGADVIKIERPDGGDFARGYDDFVEGESSHFVWLNRGKRSVVLDLKTPQGLADLRGLLRDADVLLSNLAPGALERLLPDEELDELEGLIRCHISGYGVSGPYAQRKAYDLLIQGEAGVIAATGTPEQKARPGVSLADLAGGMYALAAINAALVEKRRTGKGQRIDIAMFDALLEWMSPLLLATMHTGTTPTPAGRGHASITPYGPYSAADGREIQVAVQNEGQWRRLCKVVLRRPDLADSATLATNGGRLQNRQEVESAVAQAIGKLTADEVIERLTAADVPYGALNSVADVLQHPQALSRHRWESIRTQSGAHTSVVTSPFVKDPSLLQERSVPAPGEHTEEVLAALAREEAR